MWTVLATDLLSTQSGQRAQKDEQRGRQHVKAAVPGCSALDEDDFQLIPEIAVQAQLAPSVK